MSREKHPLSTKGQEVPSRRGGEPWLRAGSALVELEPAAQACLGPRMAFRLEFGPCVSPLCRVREGLADLLQAVLSWGREHLSSTRVDAPKLVLRIDASFDELELAIWENGLGRASVSAHTQWSALAARVERLGGRMGVEAAGVGRWRRLWLTRSKVPKAKLGLTASPCSSELAQIPPGALLEVPRLDPTENAPSS